MTYWYALRRIGISALFSLGFAAGVHAGSVTLTPAEDATISEKDLTNSIGYEITLEAGTTKTLLDSRALLRFNLAASIPTNAIVTSASLTVRLVHTAPGVTTLWLGLHKVLRSWSESVVTWTNRLSPPASWSAPGAAAPVDYASSVTQSNLITTALGPYTFASNAAMIADVQNWVGNASNNFGWIMISKSEGVGQTETKFSSREDVVNAPLLFVQYTVPAVPPTLTPLPPDTSQFRFSFHAESNRNYSVEYCGTLPATNWSVLTNIAPLPTTTTVLVSDPFTGGRGFYRVWTP